jgi:uncharacterized protein (TIGR02302 family)
VTEPPDPRTEQTLRRLRGRRLLARWAIGFEQVWPAVWPPLGLLGLYVCAALLALPQSLPPVAQFGLLGLVAAGVLVLAWRGLRGLRRPDNAAADRRLERASGLRHRPLAVLTDRPAAADAEGAALWSLHAARAAAQIGRLRVGVPRPGLPRRDPRAFRLGLLVLLVACLVIAGGRAPARLAGAIMPSLPPGPGQPATELQAWITPPGYTGLPPIFLKPDSGAVAVPSGSHLTVSVTGGTAEPTLALGTTVETFRRLDTESWQADRELTAGGPLSVRRAGGDLAMWELSVIGDRPPTAAWTEPPGRTARGLQVRLPWQTDDDYGVASLQAELRLRDRPDAPPIVLGIPLPGGQPKTAHGVHIQDLIAHPWAGLPVLARLVAKDAPGQTGTSADALIVLPMRVFRNPTARALITARQGLSINPEDRRAAFDAIQLLLGAPDQFGGDAVALIQLGAIAGLLQHDEAAQAVDEAQSRMWDLALRLEEGQAERTARALDRARQAAREALTQATRTPDDAHRAELQKKLEELRQAIEKHMQALAEQMRREQTETPRDSRAQALTEQQMQQKAEEAEKAAREGRMEDAREKMAELEQMLDELKQASRNGAKPGEQQNAERRQAGRKQVSAVQDLIKREGALLDHTQGRTTGGQIDTLTGRPLPPPPLTAERQAVQQNDALVQKALRRALGELMQQFGDLTGKIPPALGHADAAMREAAQALSAQQDPPAADAEQRAIAALQESGREMSQQLARQFGPGRRNSQEQGEQQDSDQSGEQGSGLQDDHSDSEGQSSGAQSSQRGHSERRDPLGRQMGQGTTGADEGSDVQVPEEMERQRTRAIQDELRRRGGQRSRPQEELDYIDRLLKQF